MTEGGDGLQFDKAEFAPPAPGEAPQGGPACDFCGRPVRTYWAVTDKVACATCHERVVAMIEGGSTLARLLRSTAFGLGAGAAGAALWFGIRAATGLDIGIVAIVVGFMVGAAVRAGSENRGGLLFQLLAVAITYVAIVASYTPIVAKELAADSPEAAGVAVWILAAGISFILPFLMLQQGKIMGVIIIAFALWEAWRRNTRLQVVISGPHEVAAGGPPAAPPGAGAVPVA